MIIIQRTDTGIQFICLITDEQTGQTLDLSGVSNIQFIFRRPDKHTYSVVGSLYTDGTDSKLSYITTSSDITLAGIWKFQVTYTLGVFVKFTQWTTFQVEPNLMDLS